MSTVKKAASAVLLREAVDGQLEVYLVERARHLAFMGGFSAFPGGQCDAADFQIPVVGATDAEQKAAIACAARELFEETRVVVARGVVGEVSTCESFVELLERYELVIHASDFLPAGRWITPEFAPRRFDTRFFLVYLPEGQLPKVVSGGELADGRWMRPKDALLDWQLGRRMLAPPTLYILQSLAAGKDGLFERLHSVPEANAGRVERIEIKRGIFLFPLRTPTIAPATHTNCYIVGNKQLLIIDPASPYEEEQQRLENFLDTLIAEGAKLEEILVTHFHPDHVGGVAALRARYGLQVAAHPLTQQRVGNAFVVDRKIADGERWQLSGGWLLESLYTPGHTQDHISFYEHKTRSLLCGDLMAGFGTVVIDPPEGNLQAYLASLDRVAVLDVDALFPSHGPPTGGARERISFYISHRLEREAAILSALCEGIFNIPDIVKKVYTDTPQTLYSLAERSVLSHLEKLIAEGKVTESGGKYMLC
ncbi:MAG: MBL fold metallo-hydrolase [Acidobacteriota bacterium]|nr:MBL fold metallo-hydrolase [Blastocatellia bacterium]MDW8412233.1 MBL fold metallo-hydrolase [Acidobacteriota bacterium]